MSRYGLSKEEAGRKFFILDDKGLITKARYATNSGTMEESGDQWNVVFAQIVTEPASECVLGGGLLYPIG
jgi:hypothetical protein